MRRIRFRTGPAPLLVALALVVLLPGEAPAQCAMCRTALEQNPEIASGFNRAIAFLLVTPYAVFGSLAGYVLLSRRKRLRERADGGGQDHSSPGTA